MRTEREKRLQVEATERLEYLVNAQKTDIWTRQTVEKVGCYLWDLWRRGAGFGMPGEIVCRHVAVHLYQMLRDAGLKARVDCWWMPQEPGSPYNGHATLCYQPHLAGGKDVSQYWYYTDWALRNNERHVAATRRIRPGAEDTKNEGLPMTRDGTNVIDVQYMANHRYGRDLKSYAGPMSDAQCRRWVLEYLGERKRILREVQTDEAFELVGRDKLDRSVLT